MKDITEGVGSLKIVRAVAALAQGFGMETTVEGVENLEQLAAVKAEGCNEMQGYLFSRPCRPARSSACSCASSGLHGLAAPWRRDRLWE